MINISGCENTPVPLPPILQQQNLDINFINFNQDCSSLAIGTKTGYKLFSLNSLDKLDIIYESACRS